MASQGQIACLTAMATRILLNLSIVIVLIIFSFKTENVCSSTEEEWYPPPICNWTANYTKDSQFVSNVKAALSSLHVDNVEDTSSQSKFNISEYGQSANEIYALLQCRGDATVEECYNCSQQAETAAVVQDCANYVGSRVWSKFCFLRYNGDYNFTGQLDSNGNNETNQHFFYNIDTISSPDVFLAAVRKLLNSLASEIISGSSRNRYASNTTLDTLFRRIYALAQCWGDISLDVCQTCLSTTIETFFQVNDTGSGARGLTGNCIVQYDMKSFFNDLPPPPSPSPAAQQPQKSSSSKMPIILGVVGGLVIFLFMVCLCATRTRLKSAMFGRHTELDSHLGEDEQPIPASLSNVFTVFEMKTLVAATENFHEKNTLGEGGFGTVYKGTIPDGTQIAVKKLSLQSMQGKREFLNEVKLVAKIQHRNLVKLLGCCAEGSERLLVYEYLPNNSLNKILFDPNKRRRLDWQERYNIIVGITRGLLYLHEDSQLRIIHRDIKASNILLDEKLNPKIADFGLARLFVEDETHVRTRVAGTRGYMAPEYAMQGQLSVKADVYSFGILVLELMSGRKNIDPNLSPEMDILLEWAWRLYKRGNIMDMIDPAIVETCSDQEQALRCIHVGFLCTQAEASLRPSMSTINLMISTKYMILPDPTKPAFVSFGLTHRSNSTGNSGDSHTLATTSSSSSRSSSHIILVPPSNADASITVLVPSELINEGEAEYPGKTEQTEKHTVLQHS